MARTRTVEEIDKELQDMVVTRQNVQAELAKPGLAHGVQTSFGARIELITVRIERLLEERSVVSFEQQFITH